MTGRHGSEQQEHGNRNRKPTAHIFNHKQGVKMQRMKGKGNPLRARPQWCISSSKAASSKPPHTAPLQAECSNTGPYRWHYLDHRDDSGFRYAPLRHWQSLFTLHYACQSNNLEKSRFHDNLALMGRWEKGWSYQRVGRRKADVRKLRTRGWQAYSKAA